LAARLPVLLLLDGQIPHKPGMATVLSHDCGLLYAGKQPKPAHIKNLGTTTDTLWSGGSGASSPGKSRGFPRRKLMTAASKIHYRQN
jgi:hypothetical protein